MVPPASCISVPPFVTLKLFPPVLFALVVIVVVVEGECVTTPLTVLTA